MIPLYSTSQIREIDRFAVKEIGIPGILLMENASREIYNIIREYINYPDKVGFVCGKGNNGGDGFAAARHFANAGIPVIVIYAGTADEMSEDCRFNFETLLKFAEANKKIKLFPYTSGKSLRHLESCDVIVDALLGSGASGELKQPYKEIVEYLNKVNKFKVAVDIPTGLDADTGYAFNRLNVDLTITLGEIKKGLFIGDGYEICGEVRLGGIGIDPSWFNRFKIDHYLVEPEDAFEFLPKKGRGINKYTSGKVLTIAGSFEYPGAASMTSKSVLKSGAGASVLAFPRSAKALIHKDLTEVVVEAYDDEKKGILTSKSIEKLNKRIKWADVVAVGPGLGRAEETQEAILKLIKGRQYTNLVIDADGLFPLNDKKFIKYKLKNVVLTPHLGEFSTLIGVDVKEIKKDLLRYGMEFEKQTGCCLVLKGAPSIIFYKGEIFVNTTGNPGMAKFGTGDVLTGIISGFLSQSGRLPESVISAVYIHSLTADILSNKLTIYGFTPENIIEHFPEGIKFLKDSFVNRSE